uniref:Microtubule associated monooxygenase, calponin and LIM domain containing 3b n=1 Tax=Lates calcarifer TaxID=8187 RepID=A0A4W6C5M6_LATCA
QKHRQKCRAQELYDEFVSASTCRTALRTFTQLCEHLQLDRSAAERPLYQIIKRRLNYWRANTLWTKLDRRANQQEYLRARICNNTTCVIIGAGPCGLRTAVELSFMGARVVLLEKRDSFSRNNVLHLWPFTIHDLRGLGAKKFYGKFCAGSIDHISIRQLQLVLLKVALLLGVEVHVNVEFKNLVEPPEDQHRHKVGWRMEVSPKSHPVNQLVFDVIIGADGRRNTLPGFRRKEFRGKLAIAITANFKNRNTTAEAKVEEISGVAFIFNQRFFQELRQETGPRHSTAAPLSGERGPECIAGICPRSSGRRHVRLHLHVRIRECRHGPPTPRTPAACHTGGRQPAGGKTGEGTGVCWR